MLFRINVKPGIEPTGLSSHFLLNRHFFKSREFAKIQKVRNCPRGGDLKTASSEKRQIMPRGIISEG